MSVDETLKQKLTPNRYTAMSGKMAAIVGYVIGAQFTKPELSDLAITSDGFVLGQTAGDCGLNEWIGAASDLERNWNRLLAAADLTEQEEDRARFLYRMRVTDWRQ